MGDLARRFETAWNAHDMAAFGAFFAEDATFVSRFGHFWRGRAEIVARHAELHVTIYRDCTVANRILDVRLTGPRAAEAHVRSHVNVGSAMKNGPREFSVLFTYVASDRDDQWPIQAGHNVTVTDPATGRMLLEN